MSCGGLCDELINDGIVSEADMNQCYAIECPDGFTNRPQYNNF